MPWALNVIVYATATGLIVPFIRHPLVLLLIVATMLWQAFGFILLLRAKSPLQSFLVLWFFILPTCCTLVLFPLLGPAVITILNAFYPAPK